MKYFKLLVFSFFCTCSFAQQAYNSCNSALELCPNVVSSISNLDANKTFCPGCEDDFTFCFTPYNSIWLTFVTNSVGGDIQLDLSNIAFQNEVGRDNRFSAVLIQATTPCISAGYTAIGNCISAQSTNQTINATALLANTRYYVVLSGEQAGPGITLPAEFTMDVTLSGTAIDRPIATIDVGLDLTICANALTPVYTTRTNCENGGDFFWYVNDVHVATTSDSTYFSNSLQTGDVIRVESPCFETCPTVISFTTAAITVAQTICDAGPDAVINPGEQILMASTIGSNCIPTWTPSYALSDPTTSFPLANPDQTTTYTLSVLDTVTGCEAKDYVTITVEDGLFIPTTFSPNGDGENDTWTILGITRYPDCIVNIYNRWGQHIFQATGYNNEKAWDGRSKAGEVNEGVYFYELQLRDPEKQQLKGSITLIR